MATRVPHLRGWLHAATVPLALAALWQLWRATSPLGPLTRVPALLYGVTLVVLFTTSAAYHLPRRWSAVARARLVRLDGAATVLLVAGTFVPVAAYALEGGWRRWSLIGATAVAGVGVALALSGTALPPRAAAAAYVAMGWLAAIPFWELVRVLPATAVLLLGAGGVLYSVGALVYARRRPDPSPAWFGYHEVFHAFVIAAAATHLVAILRFVVPLARAQGG